MNKLKILMASIVAVMMLAVPGVALAEANVQGGLCAGANLDASSINSANCTDDGTATSSVQSIVTKIINIFSWVVGVVSVIMIIIGGFKYITSGGDSGSVTAAKNTIMYAIIGLVIVALAQVIVRFVLGLVTNP